MTATILSAVGAAVSFACAAILQQEAAQSVSKEQSLRLQLLFQLLRRPKWLVGVAMLLTGYGLQALALSYGPLALVQPIVVTELALAIPLAIWRRHRRAQLRDWIGIISVLAGIVTFLVAASPAEGIADPGTVTWLASLIPVGAVIMAVIVLGARSRGPRRASWLGAGAGLSFGLLAVLTKATTHQLSRSVAGAFSSWEIYLVVVFGILALVISQSAYQAGPLAFSMPLVGVLEPLVAVVIGDAALDEQVRLGAGILAVESLAAFVAVIGIVLLSTSPTVLSIYESGT